jgi:hypothetical protein
MLLIDMSLCPLVNVTNLLHLEIASVGKIGTGIVIEGATEVDPLETLRAEAIETITDIRIGRKGKGGPAKLTGKVHIPL